MLTLICDGCDGDFVYADLYPLGDFEVPDGDWFCPTCEADNKVNKQRKRSVSDGKKRGTNKNRKNARDPDAPKPPKTAYILFVQEMQPDVRAANPDKLPTAIVGLIANMWKGLSDTAKQVLINTLPREF